MDGAWNGDSWARNRRRFLDRSQMSRRPWSSATCCSHRSCRNSFSSPIWRGNMVRNLVTHACALAAGVAITMVCASRPAPANEFDGALRAVMVQMDAGMCITPSGDADRDFARTMIPHHQGAIEMARLELLYGRDARLRRLAQGIVVEQSQEIALLRSLVASSSSLSGGFNP